MKLFVNISSRLWLFPPDIISNQRRDCVNLKYVNIRAGWQIFLAISGKVPGINKSNTIKNILLDRTDIKQSHCQLTSLFSIQCQDHTMDLHWHQFPCINRGYELLLPNYKLPIIFPGVCASCATWHMTRNERSTSVMSANSLP